jgi:tetraacyldisaccharide 4'-kinase
MARRRLTTPVIVPVPVVCVGNLTVGGTGKTPVVLALARWLGERGARVHCLTRGYGGALAGPVVVDGRHDARAVGDEAMLLAATAPTVVSRERAAGARLAIERGAAIIVMDDGFQNPRLAKTLSLVVVDGAIGFGNGRLVPAGPLREPIATGLARADAVVLVGNDTSGVRARLGSALPIIPARLAPHDAWNGLRGRRVVAFAGIGRPQKFFDMVAAHGITLAARFGFADHHRYTDTDLDRLDHAATRADAVLVTTAKDAVRLPAAFRARITVLGVTLAWDDPATPERLLAPLLTPR